MYVCVESVRVRTYTHLAVSPVKGSANTCHNLRQGFPHNEVNHMQVLLCVCNVAWKAGAASCDNCCHAAWR